MNFFKPYLNEHNLLGIRVAVSVAIAFFIGSLVGLERSYWAVLTIISVNISMSWGDILVRSWLRFIMSIFGFILGTLIYYYFFLNEPVIYMAIFAMLAGVLTFYFTFTSYSISMFMMGLFVVMFFAAIGNWNESLLIIRIYETFLGAIISLIIGLLISPQGSNKKNYQEIQLLWLHYKETMQANISSYDKRIDAFQKNISEQRSLELKMINMQFELKKKITKQTYQNIFTGMTDVLFHYVRWWDLWLMLNELHPEWEILITMRQSFDLSLDKPCKSACRDKLEGSDGYNKNCGFNLLMQYYATVLEKAASIEKLLDQIKK